MLRLLFEHLEWADNQLLNAIEQSPQALGDEAIRKNLHHIVMVHRFFLWHLTARPFDLESESKVPATVAALRPLLAEAHQASFAFLDGLSSEGLQERFDSPFFKDFRPSVETALIQVVLHGQNHRGQILTRMRELGGKAPTLDYILWTKERSRS